MDDDECAVGWEELYVVLPLDWVVMVPSTWLIGAVRAPGPGRFTVEVQVRHGIAAGANDA